jgi:diguanylate cyclase (GGDEF)-like protein/PAS domain S-box-containing protein
MEEMKISILYIEDEESISKEIVRVLHNKVEKVYTAADGEEGLALYFQYLPKIIITDLYIPKINGIDLIERIRRFDKVTPIIVLSSYNEVEFLKKSIELNVTHYLNKPIDVTELFNTLVQVIDSVRIKSQNELLFNKLKKERKKYKQLMTLSTESIYIVDMDTKLIEYSDTVRRQLGYSEDEMSKLHMYDIDTNYSKEEIIKVFSLFKDEPIEFETEHKRNDGTKFTVSMRVSRMEIGSKSYVYAVSRDMSEYKKLYNRLQKLLDTQTNILMLTNGKMIQYANKSLLEFFGYSSLLEFKQELNCICEKFIQNERYFHLPDTNDIENWIDKIATLPKEKRIVAMLNSSFEVHVFSIDINQFDNELILITFTDISQNILKTMELEDKVIHDKLTGAYNREYFENNITSIIDDVNPFTKIAISYMDIDHFKMVNDTYGHDVGDFVLKELVNVAKRFSRQDDIIIRFGGEEFVLVLKVKTKEGAIKALEHLRVVVEGHDFSPLEKLTCSFGLTFHKEGENIDATLKRADEALYNAKKSGRNQIIFTE